MKTAISVPDPIFKAADRLARRRRVSRSQLYTQALQALLQREDDTAITAQLDATYADSRSGLDPALSALPGRLLEREDW